MKPLFWWEKVLRKDINVARAGKKRILLPQFLGPSVGHIPMCVIFHRLTVYQNCIGGRRHNY